MERPKTHEGGAAFPHIRPEQALRRSVLSCLLWESEFYEDGKSIADRIWDAAMAVPAETLAGLAVEARVRFNLRHVPLLLCSALVARKLKSSLVGDTIARVVDRADELAEFLAVYAKANGVEPNALKPKLAAQVKRGLALAFQKFDAYRLAKYNRDGAIKLRDVLFLCHAKPKDEEQAALWKRLIDGTLESPDTWEVALSGGADKKDTFERLLREEKLGYFALLRNLRNMEQAGCDPLLVKQAILARKGGAHRVLPFRYVAAAKAAPRYEPELDASLAAAIAEMSPLGGSTVVLVDVSGSMDVVLSAKSDLQRIDAAAALAAVIPASDLRIFTFSNEIVEIPPRKGIACIDAVMGSQPHGGTHLGAAVKHINEHIPYDRLIVVSDEQSHDSVPAPGGRGYMINVASSQNGVGYGKWTHIDGFSEQVIRFIHEHEAETD